ncbi:MAG: cryptochrome/photolyase family protein, partial [Cyclobacteriaceae bacterium]
MEITLVFPHQLFKTSPATGDGRIHILFEDPLYFRQYSFHTKKLILHRASMKYYQSWLEQKGISCEYAEASEFPSLENLLKSLKKRDISCIHYVLPDDYLIERRLNRCTKEAGIESRIYQNPSFLLDLDSLDELLGDRKSYFMASFYKKQRKKLNLLMSTGGPAGGKWSFDEENRKKLPDDIIVPEPSKPRTNDYVREAIVYV